LKIKLF